MSTSDIIMDRTFDASCLKAKGETEWANQIMNRVRGKYPNYGSWIDDLEKLYDNMVTASPQFLSRADYLIEHKATIRLRF